MRKRAWWAAMLACILLAGWGFWHLRPAGGFVAGPPNLPAPVLTASTPLDTSKSVPVLDRQPPYKMVIKKISLWVLVDSLGLKSDGRIETPPFDKSDRAFWYRNGPAPGERGPAVLLGHVDNKERLAAFFYLSRVRPGNEIDIVRKDKSTAVFTVTSVEQFPKTDFPTERVYGPTATPTLRLVTCGGPYDHRTQSYKDNIVVFATLTDFRAAVHA